MMTTYTKSKSSDFGGNINQRQLHNEIMLEEGIIPALIGIDFTGDVIDIIFDSILSAGEEIILNTLISNHIPDNSKSRGNFYIVIPQKNSIKTGVYTKCATFKYDGSDVVGDIDYVDIISYMDTDVISYNARVYDKTNNTILCEKVGITNLTETIDSLGLISNVPTSQSILELQIQKIGGNNKDYIYIDSINIYYGN